MNKTIYKKMAALAVRQGINLKKGQEVILTISTNAQELASYIVEEAYKRGAKKVQVRWINDNIQKLSYKYADLETLSTTENWEIEKMKRQVEVLPCCIYVEDSDPDTFNDIDVEKYTQANISRRKVFKPYNDEAELKYQWTIIAIPSVGWAKKVFPNDKDKVAVKKLWDAIIKCTRLDGKNPVKNWDEHIKTLTKKANTLNDLRLDYLKYESSNGTNLKIKLQPNHCWLSAKEKTLSGVEYVANMPTEEVFTMPARDGVDGVVVATKPLALNGQVIEGIKVHFEGGKAVKLEATKGLEMLEKTLEMDENSKHLGEVALVPYTSPINQTGIMFYNTLFDENACCHLAFGRAFENNIIGWENMTKEDYEKIGFNNSLNHIDFMVGSKDLSIKGYDFSGKEHIIFKDGNWAI